MDKKIMKKCIVLDLDNTLWGGIIGEDGIENIQLSISSPGNSFLAFQQAILDLYDRGIILAINSRNNPEDAWNMIRNHPNMVLKEKHFAAHRINWNDKAQNLREIAQELNIGLDSMVFLDDDITNRRLVGVLVPEVETPDLPINPKEYTRFLNSLPYFKSEVTTDEDKMRGNLYVTERLRREEEKKYEKKEDFFTSLGLELNICENDASCLPRLAQLTEKTNQFNTRKQPFTEKQILEFMNNDHYKIYHGKLQDIFGDHGVVIFALIEILNGIWHIQSILMSCRVFGRGVEDAFLAEIMKKAHIGRAALLSIAFAETEKNAPAKAFIDNNFINNTVMIPEHIPSPSWIKIIYGKI